MRTIQKIKNLVLVCIVALTAMACPSDDDNPGPTQDPLVGTWKYFKYFENGVEQTLDPCDTEETFVYAIDGTAVVTYYDLDGNGACVLDETFNGTWANVGNGNYSFTANGFTDTENIIFEGNTHYFEYVYDNGTPDDTSDDIIERDVYIKQ
jgi:hypothetical protein